MACIRCDYPRKECICQMCTVVRLENLNELKETIKALRDEIEDLNLEILILKSKKV